MLLFGDNNNLKTMPSHDNCLTVAIFDLIILEVLCFNIFQKPRLKKVLYQEINVSKGYNPPNRNIIAKYLLDFIHDQNMQRKLIMIITEAECLRLLFIGDSDTISRTPLLNILVLCKNIPVEVLELVYSQGHLADGGKKYGPFICNRYLEHLKKYIHISK